VVTGTAVGLVLALAACASGPEAGAGGQAVTGTDAERSLRGVCPATVVVQTSWYPESTHGGIYQLLGTGYTLDKARKRVRGPLVSRGADTGVQLEIRAGGPAVGNQPVSALMATDTSITLGQQATEEQVRGWAAKQPTVAVAAPFDVDPVVLIWDRERHPGFRMIQDVGQTKTKVLTFQSPNIDYLLGGGILRPGQIDYSYDGSPSRLLADRSLVVGGFSTNEPFIYRGLGVDVDYQYIETTAYPNYRNTLVVRQVARQQLDPCLRRLVPAFQQGMVDFMAQPDPVLRLIVTLNEGYGSPFPYPLEQARYGVRVMKQDGLVANPASMRGAPFGALNPARVDRMLTILRPIYAAQRTPVPADATAAALATNDYLDSAIRLPDS
jgi:hypothetical protein